MRARVSNRFLFEEDLRSRTPSSAGPVTGARPLNELLEDQVFLWHEAKQEVTTMHDRLCLDVDRLRKSRAWAARQSIDKCRTAHPLGPSRSARRPSGGGRVTSPPGWSLGRRRGVSVNRPNPTRCGLGDRSQRSNFAALTSLEVNRSGSPPTVASVCGDAQINRTLRRPVQSNCRERGQAPPLKQPRGCLFAPVPSS